MTLRPYQSDQVRLLRESFAKGHKRTVLASPTGSGKSLVMAEMTRMAFEKGKRVILLTHRMELFKATLKHIGSAGIPCVELSAGSQLPAGDWKVMLAMEKTLWNRIATNPGLLAPDLIIADEIHFQNFTKILDHYSDCHVIGFSATPQGKHLHKIYGDLVSNIDIPELIDQGFLVPCKPYQMQDNFDDVKISKGEFEDKALFQHFNKAKLYEGIIEEYQRHVAGQKGIVFCVNVEHTEKTYDAFIQAGIKAFKVHSKMPAPTRDSNVQQFESEPDGVMINCGILTTGYDCPSIEFVIVYRATTSLPLWLQMQGRGSRPSPGKLRFTVLDFGQNHNRHGLWNQPRQWSLAAPKKIKKAGPAAVKDCPSCGAMIYASCRSCQFCQYEFPIVINELREGIMVEIKSGCPVATKGKRISELSIDELIDLEKVKKYKSSFIWRCVRTRGAESLNEYAHKKGYKPGWTMNQMKEIAQNNIGFKDYILK